ncbi:MAG: hypothetical protein KKB37_11215 [Alphaproteobacteria bacterium]|nr:hypothetical protein [Alphaproteobacteria bacterium]
MTGADEVPDKEVSYDAAADAINTIAIGLFAGSITFMLAATQTWSFTLPRGAFLAASFYSLSGSILLEIIRAAALCVLVLHGSRRMVAVDAIAFSAAALVCLPTLISIAISLYKLAPCAYGFADVCVTSGNLP